MFFLILLTKLLRFLGGLLGRGSSLPGLVALRLCPNVLGKLKLPEIVVAVTGSNGKTSTTELIKKAALATGKRVVCNSEGSNQTEGVATALLSAASLTGRVKADIVILESDERFCQYTFKHFTPSHIAVLNLYRDQLTRNGNSEFVKGELKKGLPKGATLILNADEPMSASLAEGRTEPVLWFGVEPNAMQEDDIFHAYNDGAFCPLCTREMTYDYRIFAHLGGYRCTGCEFTRPMPHHAVTDSENGVYTMDGAHRIVPQLDNPMFACNLAAAYTVAVEVFGLTGEQAAAVLTGHELSNAFQSRLADFRFGGHDGTFLLCKHENSIAYDGAIEAVCRAEQTEKTVAIVVNLLSRKYIANDMSWLWDIDFERLVRDDVKQFFVGGLFAEDVAARLLFAGVKTERIHAFREITDMTRALENGAVGHIFALTCFTDAPGLLPILKEGGK